MTRRRAAAALLITALAVTAVFVASGSRRRQPAPTRPHRSGRPGRIPARARSRRTFYLSPAGNDRASGRTPAHAWRTVDAVNRARLRPGDTVLFRAGATFADDVLMPGEGTRVSGTARAPITFGSYGRSRARIVHGVFFRGEDHLVFEDLAVGPAHGITAQGLQGTGNAITVRRLSIAHVALGIETVGDDWRIVHTTIRDTGDSGMLLGFSAGHAGDPPGGSSYLVAHDTILDTGLNRRLTFGTHGIYVKVARATIIANTISGFHDDGISLRYRDSVVQENRISHGPIGLAWFQYDTRPGTSRWRGNVLSAISLAAIFVCGPRQGCRRPLEHFAIARNAIHAAAGAATLVAPWRR